MQKYMTKKCNEKNYVTKNTYNLGKQLHLIQIVENFI